MNVDTLMAAMPGLARATAQQYQPLNDAAMREFGITSQIRSRHWLAQVGHESLSLRYLEEIADGSAYEGRKDLGNTQPGDGKRYKGRGPIQVTGRYNYTAAATAMKLDLVNQPQLASQPQHAFRISAWWWSANGCNPIADRGAGDDVVVAMTRKINGGLNGIDDRRSRFSQVGRLGSAILPEQGGGAGPSEVVEDMAASAVADNGSLHTFIATAGAVYYAYQPKDKSSWSGGEAGKRIAGMSHFAAAPAGRKIVGLTAERARNGNLHVFVALDDGSVAYTWQRKGESGWAGGAPGKGVAGLSAFCPRP